MTYQGGMTGSGGAGAAAVINGSLKTTGSIDAGGEITGAKVKER